MTIIIALMLATAQPAPTVTTALHPARAETRRSRGRARGNRNNARYKAAANVQTLAAICDSAGRNGDPAAYLASLGAALGMPKANQAALQKACALYLADRPGPQPAIKMFR